MELERMDAFFAARAHMYDEHMLSNVEGCKNGYIELTKRLPSGTKSLLDLGCGTGLELHEIFARFPDLEVTGIDITPEMLEQLRRKFADKHITLINASYFDCDLGVAVFDAAVSFQTMHHFSHEEKIALYTRTREALKPGGCYIECDYMITDQAEEELHYAENHRLRAELGIPDGEFYHYDTPCTIENQITMLLAAGFSSAEYVWREGNTTMIVAKL